jgi:hypothetical protein
MGYMVNFVHGSLARSKMKYPVASPVSAFDSTARHQNVAHKTSPGLNRD